MNDFGSKFKPMDGFGYKDPMANYGQVAPGYSFTEPAPQFGMSPDYDVMKQFGIGVPNFSNPVSPNTLSGNALGDWMKNSGFLGSKNADGTGTEGWGGAALGAGQGLLSAFMGMKQYGLSKKTLAHNQNVFNKNYDAQRQTTNTRLEDRQNLRVNMNANTAMPVEDYMNKNRIK